MATKLQVDVPRVQVGIIQCLFFGKTTKLLFLKYKGVGHPCGNKYPVTDFHCPELEIQLQEIKLNLGLAMNKNEIYKLANGIYVHLYGNTHTCSSVLCLLVRNFSISTHLNH